MGGGGLKHSCADGAYLDGGWAGGEGDQRTRCFVADSGRGRVEEVVDAAYEASTLSWVGVANLVDQLHNYQLENVIEVVDLVDAGREVVQCTLLQGKYIIHNTLCTQRSHDLSCDIPGRHG